MTADFWIGLAAIPALLAALAVVKIAWAVAAWAWHRLSWVLARRVKVMGSTVKDGGEWVTTFAPAAERFLRHFSVTGSAWFAHGLGWAVLVTREVKEPKR